MNDSDLARRVLAHVQRANYRPVKPRVIAKQLKLPKEQHTQLKREIKRLVKSGRLTYGVNHVVHANRKRVASEVVGIFRRTLSGYGFVRPAGTPLDVGRGEDIFIPVSKTMDAASGDTVRVELGGRRSRSEDGNRSAGRVVEIVERATKHFVGTYEETPEGGLVYIDGKDFVMPIVVGDPGAKQVHDGDKVVVELIRYPTGRRAGDGVITEVLGPRGQPGVDTLTVIREFGLPDQFPEDVLEESRRVAEEFDGAITDGRRDLTSLDVITIDPRDARDFDDAISLERLENGHWRLGVHVADVTHFVRPKTALDREARDRGTSVYLPDRVIPMLPEVVSNHLASLQPKQVRYVKSALIEYTEEGTRVGVDFCVGAIRSRRRFSYEEVDALLSDRVVWRAKLGPELYTLVDNLHRLAMLLRRRRLEKGSIELNLPETKIELDREGRVCGAHRVEHTESHQLIEEFMLAANEAVAERIKDEEVHCLRRIHAAPDAVKIANLTEFVRNLDISCESLESRFETKRVLAAVEGEPVEPAVNYAVLRAMQKAVYSPQDQGHYALAFQDYCHFTSPIRRYPDLTIHRIMDAIFRGQRAGTQYDHLLTLGEHCSQREQRAEAAERELIKLKLLMFLSDKIGQRLDVVVTGVEEFGLFAQGIKLPAEGLIHVNSLRGDVFRYEPQIHALEGHRESYRLGDLLTVEISNVDLDRRELDLVIVDRLNPDLEPDDPFQLDATDREGQRRPGLGRFRQRSAGMGRSGNECFGAAPSKRDSKSHRGKRGRHQKKGRRR